ncbi:hypothetical protein [Serratia quinivorans]|uniref:hypothetical protein n=1 Tax=Serratia quinivorans TaxID=137545 RepID=UPI0021B828E6|nr:hypothetical protein [Serratia quinivorans]
MLKETLFLMGGFCKNINRQPREGVKGFAVLIFNAFAYLLYVNSLVFLNLITWLESVIILLFAPEYGGLNYSQDAKELER